MADTARIAQIQKALQNKNHSASYVARLKAELARLTTPAATAAPPPPVYNPYASAQYLQGVSQGQREYDTSINRINFGLNQGALDIGGDPTTGKIDYSTIDATNPFSKAALLQRSYAQQRAGTTNSLAAAGQLRSGAAMRQRADQQFRYEQGQDQLQKALIQLIGQADLDKRSASDAQAGSNYQALLAALAGAPQP